MRHKTLAAIVAFVLGTQLFALGQEYKLANDRRASINNFSDVLADLSSALKANPKLTKDDNPVKGLLNHLDFTTLNQPDQFVRSIVSQEILAHSAAVITQMDRPDQQKSAASNASGTTSLVSKAGATDLLSLALDAGALTRSVNGSTATINGNLDGMFRGLTGYSPLCVYPCPDFEGKNAQWVDRHLFQPINVSVVTALAQQSSTTAPAAGQASGTKSTPLGNVAIPTGAGKLTSVTARYQILNKYDPHSESFKQKWETAKQKNSDFASTLLTANTNTLAVRDIVLKTATPLDRDEIIDAAKAGDQQLADYFDAYYRSQVQKFSNNADFSSAVFLAVQGIASHQQIWEKVREQAAGTLFTLEYSYNRPLSQPETHDFKIIYGYAPGSVSGMLSLNGAFSLYGGTLPVGAKYSRLRDGQVSGQYDRSLTVGGNPNLMTLTLGGYWQYQPNPSILNIPAGTVAPGTTIPIPNGTQEFVGTAGSLWVTQAKVTINAKSGISIPIGVKWSNKSDLLSGNKIGAQVGISYDFSSLSGLFGGNTAK